jgi:PHP domain
VHDLSCVVHLHSVFSDGTGTVEEIARAAARAGADVVLLTDHDTMAAWPGWYGDVLVLVGVEVSPKGENHYLAFGLDEPIDWRGLSGAEIVRAVHGGGGFGFAAHPFSKGSERFRQRPMAWPDLDGVAGIEVWSFVTDVAERIGSVREALRFLARPERFAVGPPEENLREWDRLNRERRVLGIGGIDAHQIGVRLFDRWVVRLMGYARTFRQLRTHVWVGELPNGDLDHDRALVFDALREGRCYIAVDAFAPARGFAFWGDGVVMGEEAPHQEGRVLHATLPRPAELRLLRDGELVKAVRGVAIDHEVSRAGVYRVEAWFGRRCWILSNPIYLR